MNITSWPNEPNIVDGAYNPPSKGYDNNKGFLTKEKNLCC